MSDCASTPFVGRYDIPTLPQGSDSQIRITYKPNGTVVDLTTYTAKLQVRQHYDGPVLVELSTADSSIVLAATAPNITLNFTSAKLEGLTIYEGMIYDLEITSGAGAQTRVIEGSFSISRPVTR